MEVYIPAYNRQYASNIHIELNNELWQISNSFSGSNYKEQPSHIYWNRNFVQYVSKQTEKVCAKL